MNDSDPASIAGVIVILVLSLSWHEAAHAWVADRLGDPTARSLGRVTLNPLKHLDPFLSVLLPMLTFWMTGFIFGGGKPVPINVMNFRNRARDFMLVALAGPGSNILLALGFSLVFLVAAASGAMPALEIPNPYGAANVIPPQMLRPDPDSFLQSWLATGVFINLLLAFFNLIPLPPLDGSRVVGWLLPRGLQRTWYALDRYGFLLVLALIYYLHARDSNALFDGVESIYVFVANHVDDLVMRIAT